MNNELKNYLDQIAWNADGLAPAIAQDAGSGKVLNLAWMNRQSLELTFEEKRAVYWSRSRACIWRKGEESGHVQVVEEIRVDCDKDVILLKVRQEKGIACHTGRESCFYFRLEDDQWQVVDPVLKDPDEIYKK